MEKYKLRVGSRSRGFVDGSFAFLLFLTSCASVFNERTTTTKIYTTRASKIIFNKDTIETFANKAKLNLERRKETLFLRVISDSLEKRIVLKPQNSFNYYGNILTYGIGFLVDKKKPKRYGYPRKIFLNSLDTLSKYFRYDQEDKKGQLHLHLSLPHINNFLLKPINESAKTNTGFWGISIGMDYYYQNNKFLNISASAVSDFFVPIPAAVDIKGEYELMTSSSLYLSNNYKIRRFSIGYGLSYSRNTWDLRYYDLFNPPPPSRPPVKKSKDAFGFIFSSYYQLGKCFNIGVIYRPSFWPINSEQTFQYEHLISMDFAWKLY